MKKMLLLFLGFTILSMESLVAQNNSEDLFNGKNLAGWIQYNGKAKYTVENGEIVGRTVPGEPIVFYRPKNYTAILFWI